ncbi:MAG: hypothetical protein JXB62_16320 [Pirellulales bacterium]|nr:hypothetical protein [Pirellulales bacterium]
MRKNWKVLATTAALTMAVGVVAVAPVFGQGPRGGRGGRGGGESRGPGGPGGEFRGPGGPGGEFRGPGGPGGEFRGPGGPGGEFRGPGGPGGEFRGGGPPGRGFRGEGGDDRSRVERYESFLSSLDTNHNGQIDPDEAEGPRQFFVTRLAERAGVEAKFPLSISRLREGLQKQNEGEGSNSGDDSGKSGDSSKKGEDNALVPGFGIAIELVPVLKFGEAPPDGSKSTRGASARSGGPPSASSGEKPDERIRRWAETMISQNDRNHNGRLERDEWGEVRDAERADLNHDGVITADELAVRLNEYSRSRSGNRGSDSDRPPGSDRAGPDSGDSSKRKSYRFLSPIERLPAGLPDWFARKDTNGDGQVAMAEYETFWTDSRAAEFGRYDLNNDGMIIPDECLAAAESSAGPTETAMAPRPQGPGRPDGGPKPDDDGAKPEGGGRRVWAGFGDE